MGYADIGPGVPRPYRSPQRASITVDVANVSEVVRLTHAADYVIRHAVHQPDDPDKMTVPADAIRLLGQAHQALLGVTANA